MEASTRLLHLRSSTRHHLLLSKPLPSRLLNPSPKPSRFLPLPKLPSCPRRIHSPHCFSDSLSPKLPSCHRRNPFLSLSTSPSHSLSSSSPPAANQDLSTSSSPYDRPHQCPNLSDLGFGAAKADTWMVVLLGWLGAEEKHMKRYAEMYGARGFRTVRFVVPVKETLGLDLCRNVEERIQGLAAEIAGWCAEGERDGMERNLVFHTFSNTGWLA